MRRPPAFQCYASDLLANERYFTLAADERGLYHSICLGCWVGDSVPAAAAELGGVVRLDQDTVARLLPRIRANRLVESLPSDGTRLYVPELAEQMEALKARRMQQSAAGTKGGRETQSRFREAREQPDGSSDCSSERSSALSRDETSREEQKRVYKKEPFCQVATQEHRAWMQDYERAEH